MSCAVVAGCALLASPSAQANPTGGSVAAGSANITGQGTAQVTINQASDRAVINWQDFSIASGEKTTFAQPSSHSVTLNRVTGGNISQIFGALEANGTVILSNPNGILIGPSGTINAGGFVATTHDVNDADFMAGAAMHFSASVNESVNATVENQGTITIAQAGLAAFVAPVVRNSGVIQAKLGRVALGSANGFTLDLYGDDLISFVVSDRIAQTLTDANGDTIDALVKNTGTISAEGGKIALTAAAAREVVNGSVNVGGNVNASSVTQKGGAIVLSAGDVDGNVSGRVTVTGDVSAKGTTGGTVEATAENVTIASTAQITADGAAGGGAIQIGGGPQGTGALLHAQTVTIQKDALLSASATKNGKGGQIAVWSDQMTQAHGTFKATGGTEGGDGGNIETSGASVDFKEILVNAGSTHGLAGLWLLDPVDLTIDAAGAAAISSALENTSVTATTSSCNVSYGTCSGTTGNITVSSPITRAAGGAATTLNLIAAGKISISKPISGSSSNPLSIWLSGGGSIYDTANLTTYGGDIVMRSNAQDIAVSGAGNNAITVSSGTTLSTSGGDIILGGGSLSDVEGRPTGHANASGYYGILLDGSLVAGGGDISARGESSGTSYTGVRIGTSTVSTTGDGNVTLEGLQTNGNAGVIFTGSPTISTENGLLRITGTGAGIGLQFGGSASLFSTNDNIILTGISGTNSAGVSFQSTTTNAIYSTSGDISITGIAGGTGADFSLWGTQYFGRNADSSIVTNGIVTLTATGSGNFTTSASMSLASTGTLAINAKGNLSITNALSGVSGQKMDVLLSAGGYIYDTANITTYGGNVVMRSNAQNTANSNTSYAAITVSGATVSTGGGDIVLGGGSASNANGYPTDYANSSGNAGVYIYNTSLAAAGGNISIRGESASASNYGIQLGGTSLLSTTNSGTLTLNGLQTNAKYGIYFNGNETLSTVSGALAISATGGSSGIGFNSGSLTHTIYSTSGPISITGVGGTNGNGLYFDNNTATTYVYSTSGDISITGAGNGTGMDFAQNGYQYFGTNSDGSITTSGVLTLTATGVGNYTTSTKTTLASTNKVEIDAKNNITLANAGSWNGDLILKGGSVTINAAQTMGSHNFLAQASAGSGIAFGASGGITSNAGGSIALIGDSLSDAAGSTNVQTTGTITIEPYTTDTSIGLNGGTGTLALSSSLLNLISAGNKLIIGGSNTGTITTNAKSWTENVQLISGLGSIAINGVQAMGTYSLLAETGAFGDIIMGASGGIASSASGDAVILASGRNFTNNAGSSAVSVTGGGRWLIYSTATTGNSFGNLNSANTAIWNATYTGATVSQTGNRYLFATQPTLTFTTSDLSKNYGDDASASVAADYAVSGLSAGLTNVFAADTASTAFSGTPLVSSSGAAATAHVTGSPYAITIAQNGVTGLNGYAIGSLTSASTLTINPIGLTITAEDKSKDYGAALPALTATYSGFVNGDSASSLMGLTLATTATAGSHVAGSPYTISASGASNGDYTISYINGALTVNPVTLTITANDASKTYGDTNPTFTASYNGFVNGDTAASLTTRPSFSQNGGADPVAGTYTLSPYGAASGDYAISYINGHFVVLARAAQTTDEPVSPSVLLTPGVLQPIIQTLDTTSDTLLQQDGTGDHLAPFYASAEQAEIFPAADTLGNLHAWSWNSACYVVSGNQVCLSGSF